MRLTLHHSLTGHGDVDLEVARGTPLWEIVAGIPAGPVWCGEEALDPTHASGQWPLLAGAVLSARPHRARAAPTALHLAAISGPDAGLIIPLDSVSVTVIGSAPAQSPTRLINAAPRLAVVRDDTIDTHHATVLPISEREVRVKDNNSVNGTGVWSVRAGALSWRGRRRTATVRVGDVVEAGRTLFEVRWSPTPDSAIVDGSEPATSHRRQPAGDARSAIPLAITRATHRLAGFLGLADCVPGHDPPPATGMPDPTRTGGWTGPVTIAGVHALGLARAVILARGRRPPDPMPLDEPWLSWLPPALVGDGAIRIGVGICAESNAPRENGWTILTADDERTTLRTPAVTSTGPVVRVAADTADVLARSVAGASPDPPPRMIRWADAAALRRPGPGGHGSPLEVVAGVMVDEPSSPWTVALGPASRHTVIAGAPGSGKTTLLATIAGALAVELTPQELALVILCAGAPGALEPYLDLPHVRAAATHASPSGALCIVNSLDTGHALTVIIADDVDALGPDGRAVTARLEHIAARSGSGHVHVVMATRRPTAVLTPTLRAATGTAIALRTDCASDSVEVTGVDASAGIPLDAQGMAYVRSAGRIARVQVALPIADRVARVRAWDAPVPQATTLADAARAAAGSRSRAVPARYDLTRPAS